MWAQIEWSFWCLKCWKKKKKTNVLIKIAKRQHPLYIYLVVQKLVDKTNKSCYLVSIAIHLCTLLWKLSTKFKGCKVLTSYLLLLSVLDEYQLVTKNVFLIKIAFELTCKFTSFISTNLHVTILKQF